MDVNWGVLGAGSVAQRRVMPAMNSHPQCSLSALMVRDLSRAEKLAGEFGAEKFYDRAEDLFSDDSLDAIYISSPVNLHRDHTLAAAAAGKHVLCEKPMALTSGACREMIDACEEAGVQLQVCFVLRGWPIYHQVKEIVGSGKLGKVIEFRAHLAKWTPRSDDDWRLDPLQSGGGALIDVGSHYLDLFRYLGGDFKRVSCSGSSAIFGWEVEESAFLTVEFQAGAHGILGMSYAIPHSGNILEVYGTEGTLFLGKTLRVVTGEGEEEFEAKFPDYYSGLLTNFCRCLAGEAQPIAPGRDGLDNTVAIETAYQSLIEGKFLEI